MFQVFFRYSIVHLTICKVYLLKSEGIPESKIKPACPPLTPSPLFQAPIFKFFKATVSLKNIRGENRIPTVINVIDLVLHDLNIKVFDQRLDLVDGNTCEDIEGQRRNDEQENQVEDNVH